VSLSLLLSLVVAGPLPDLEPPNPYLAQAKELYEQLDFEKCMQRIRQAGQWKGSNVHELRDVELYGALCAFNLGQKAEAAERFKQALRIDEDLELPEFASPKALRLFLYVKRKLRQPSVPPMPDEDLPPDTPPPGEKLTTKGDLKAAADPSLGVTTSGRTSPHVAPIALGVASLAVGGIAIGLGLNAKSLEAQAKASKFESDYLSTRSQAQANAIAADVAWAVMGALALTALIVLFVQP
jgi:hypothetical protein